jgi:acyl-homoserine-lactone acylase
MYRKSVSIQSVMHEFWFSEYGPIVESAQLPWTRTRAYALADANASNNRYLRQLLEIGTSRNVQVLRRRLARTMGLVWLNTLAADAQGNALFADFSAIPNVPKALYRACGKTASFPQARLVNVMDGSRSECAWRRDYRAAQWGIMPAARKPSLLTREYVANSNASHWLVNPSTPLEGFSPMVGSERTPLNLRTRQAHLQIREHGEDGTRAVSKLDIERLEAVAFTNRDFLAELVLDELLSACAANPAVTIAADGSTRNLREPCAVLEHWDRKDDLSSAGAHLFREFAREVRPAGEEDVATVREFWRIPFDPSRPLETPAGLDTSTAAPLEALARAVQRLEQAGIPLDARLGDIQFIERLGRRIALPGGLNFNRISLRLTPGLGYTEPMGSADSYIQVVAFDAEGPRADIVLVNSQSSDPSSPWYADQADLYARKQWVRAPYSPADIAAQAIEPAIVLSWRA